MHISRSKLCARFAISIEWYLFLSKSGKKFFITNCGQRFLASMDKITKKYFNIKMLLVGPSTIKYILYRGVLKDANLFNHFSYFYIP